MFLLAEDVDAGFAIVSNGAGAYVKATSANLRAAKFVVAGVITANTSSGNEAPGVSIGRLPDGFLGSGSQGKIIIDPTGVVIRGLRGRSCGWTDENGNG